MKGFLVSKMQWEICMERKKYVYWCEDRSYVLIDLQNLLENKSHVPLLTGNAHNASLPDIVNELMRRHKTCFGEQLSAMQECILIDFLAARRLMRSASPLQIVEIGAADGILSFHLASMIGQYNTRSGLCCVSDTENVQWSEKISKVGKTPEISRVAGAHEHTKLPSDQYDIVILNSNEQFTDMAGVVREAKRLIRSKGIVICLEKKQPLLSQEFKKEFPGTETFEVNSYTTVYYAEAQKDSVVNNDVSSEIREAEEYLAAVRKALQEQQSREQLRSYYQELEQRINAVKQTDLFDLKAELIDCQDEVLNAMYPVKPDESARQQKILLSIGVLASNEKASVQRCLESLTPIREKICCELIIMDTGCDENMQYMLAGYADILKNASGCENPSEIRNQCFQCASGEYFMFLDSDEWLAEPEDLIKFFQCGRYSEFNSLNFIQRNFSDTKALRFTDTRAVRAFRRGDDIDFEDKTGAPSTSRTETEKELRSIIGRYLKTGNVTEEAARSASEMMSKDQKKQIEELALLFGQAHGEIRKALSAQEADSALRLLEDCQSSAILLGEQIEQTQGEDFVTVRYLEEYCEQVYQLYQLLEREKDTDRETEYGQEAASGIDGLDAQAEQIAESIRRDIPARREAVFLPYKASMWDALESVWQAADADPEWDAYVIPIPYYDRRPDGSLGQLHYEGSQFPSYVPVTSYREYDLEKRRPDVVFIHNPYDGYNRVTSVHPDFYSDVLRQYTDRLVYIPYFVAEEFDFKDTQRIQSFAHFCLAPGVIYSNKVFVQSEKVRQVYVDALTKEYGTNTKKHWQDKIYGTGSPQIEKILRTRKDDLTLPSDWQKVIYKPDGTPKKIILYNTSIGSLLQAREKMLDKMRNVFRIFKENQEETALLWRPHPLIGATIGSMLPQLWEKYQKLVREYREEGFGIYDDTSNTNRAICLCDAYYGDDSSLVILCATRGITVIVQDADIRLDEKKILANECLEYESPKTALDQQQKKFYYTESTTMNLYSLLRTPVADCGHTGDVSYCGNAIWNECKI